MTTLRLPQIRESLVHELGVVLVPSGYKVKDKKGENSFLKKYEGGYYEIQFFYDNYEPLDYAVKLTFKVYQIAIVEVIKDFSFSTQRAFVDIPNVFYTEGDFRKELAGKLVKYRSGFKNRLATLDDLHNVVIQYKKLIEDRITPLEKCFYSIQETSAILFENRDLLVSNCSENMLMTSLISLWISKSENYNKLVEYYSESLPKLAEVYGVVATKAFVLVEDLIKYLNLQRP